MASKDDWPWEKVNSGRYLLYIQIHTSAHSFFFSIIIVLIFSHCLMVQMQNANAAASRRHECPVSPYWILAGWHALERRLSDRSREEQMEVFEKDTSLPSSLASAQTFPLRH